MAVIPIQADSTLLASARQMNQEALIEIFDLYSSALYNYALRVCSDPVEADHIVGDVFAKLLEQWSAGNGPRTNLRSYLFETAYHLIIDGARSSRREAPLETAEYLHLRRDGHAHLTHSHLTRVEDQILYENVIKIIKNQLTDDQRHVIVLRFLEGFSLRETADIIGKEVYNVKVIQNRGVAKLRKALNHKVA